MSAILDQKLIDEADKYLDADAQLTEFRKTGERLFKVFGADEGRVSTQIRNLQQITVSVRRLSDIEAFIKNQMGKKTGANEWREVGSDLLAQLDKIRAKANQLSTDEGQRLLLRVYLARGWVKAVVGAYLYAKARQEMSHA
jgi:hypothetical protein